MELFFVFGFAYTNFEVDGSKPDIWAYGINRLQHCGCSTILLGYYLPKLRKMEFLLTCTGAGKKAVTVVLWASFLRREYHDGGPCVKAADF